MEKKEPGAARPATCPIAFLASAFAAGILAGPYFALGTVFLILCSSAAGVLAVVCFGRRTGTAFLLAAFFIGGGIARSSMEMPPANSIATLLDTGRISEEDPLDLSGEIANGPELMPDGAFIDLECDRIIHRNSPAFVTGRVRIYITTSDSEAASDFARMDLVPGKKILVSLTLRRQDRYRNPGGVRYADVLSRRGLEASATIKSPLLIEVRGRAEGRIIQRRVNRLRTVILRSILQTLDQPAAGIAAASVLGNRHFLSKEAADAYRSGGTFHVLVISGLHVSFVGALAIWLLSLLPIDKTYRFVFAAVAVWGFAVLTGLGTPVVRASVMFSTLALAHCFHRKAPGLNSLGLCVLAMLVEDPSAVFDPSFQLTTVSAGAIVGAAFPFIEKMRSIGNWYPAPAHPFPPYAPRAVKSFCEILYWSREAWEIRIKGQVWDCGVFKSGVAEARGRITAMKFAAALFEGLVVSSVVQIFLLPLLVIHFHRLNPAGPAINLAAGAFLLIQNFFAILASAFSVFSSTIAGPFATLSELSVTVSIYLQNILSAIPGASLRIPIYSGSLWFIYGAYYVPVIILAFGAGHWDPFRIRGPEDRLNIAASRTIYAAASVFAIFICLIVFHPYSAPAADGKLHVDFLDVGQGDAILVTFPDGATMLVDGGGKRRIRDVKGPTPATADPFEPDQRGIGEIVVSEFLWEKGYARIDSVIVTHSDADHLEGLTDVARNFDIGSAYFGRGFGEGGFFPELREILAEQDAKLLPLQSDDGFSAGGASVKVLNPTGRGREEGISENDGSVVLLITYGVRRILLTGDIERKGESTLLELPRDLKADVVKVPHHGSRTSSSEGFVRSSMPEFAVISVGNRSPFGHPHKVVVERWLAAGAEVLKTGDLGTLTVTTDGSVLEVQSFAPRMLEGRP
jgi:competence protein ComEC